MDAHFCAAKEYSPKPGETLEQPTDLANPDSPRGRPDGNPEPGRRLRLSRRAEDAYRRRQDQRVDGQIRLAGQRRRLPAGVLEEG